MIINGNIEVTQINETMDDKGRQCLEVYTKAPLTAEDIDALTSSDWAVDDNRVIRGMSEVLACQYWFVGSQTPREAAAEKQQAEMLNVMASIMTDVQAVEHIALWEAWQPGRAYKGALIVTHEGALYKLIQPHSSQADQPPDLIPALWRRLGAMVDGIEDWQPVVLPQDAANIGDLRRHNGVVWRSLIDGNCTEPGSDTRYWEVYDA